MKNFIIALIFMGALALNAQVDGVGIGTTTPNSTLDINGNVAFKVVTLDDGVTTTIDDGYYINIQPISDGFTFFLPKPDLVPGRTYILRNIAPSGSNQAVIDVIDAGNVFYASNSQGSSATINLTASGENKTIYIYSDGTSWNYGVFGYN